MRPTFRSLLLACVPLLTFAACDGGTDQFTAPADVTARLAARDADGARAAVLRWNALAVKLAPALAPTGPLAPFVEARLYAIENVAVHDALNGIRPRFGRYADTGRPQPRASAAAAVIAAGYTAMRGALPPAAHAQVQAAYDADLAALAATTDAAAISEGVQVGRRAAEAVLARRSNDGTAQGGVAPYMPGTMPGDYRFTPPFNTPGFDFFGTGGFADASEWGRIVRTFVVRNGAQFRAPPPYGASSNAEAVKTAAYTTDYNEIRAIGCAGCAARTAEQTTIALFWVESSPVAWNRIAITQATANDLDAWATARVLALVQLAEFDGYTTSLETKYHYNFWRPISAVALAGSDGNPATQPQAGWDVLAPPTPPVPDYPSAHSVAGAAAAEVLSRVLKSHAVPFTATSLTLPGVTRHFASLQAAAKENADSRVYVGFHFRHATEAGLQQGAAVGAYVVEHALRRP